MAAERAHRTQLAMPIPVEEQVVSIWTGANGHLDEVPVEDVLRFLRDVREVGHAGLHAEGHLVLLNACVCFGIADQLVIDFVHRLHDASGLGACGDDMLRSLARPRRRRVYDDGALEGYIARATATNPRSVKGRLSDAIRGADVFIGLSVPRVLTVRDVKSMARDRVVFAMANPVPEIQPEEVRDDVAIIATGRSDYPNQVNNVLCFPYIFRGALDCGATTITDEMEVAAVHAIAELAQAEQSERVAAAYARWFNIAPWGNADGWTALAGVRHLR